MAGDPVRLLVARDSHGAHLVSVVGPESSRALWPTYLVDEDGTRGPRELGNWIRFVPSDYTEAPEGPYPAPVEALIARLSRA